MIPRIGWFGLGSMGRPMAENLQRHLSTVQEHNLIYYNRTIRSGEALEELGATSASNLLDLTAHCDIIFIMVANDAVLEESIATITQGKDSLKGKIFVDCSTVHPETTRSVSATLASIGAVLVSAPVFGGPSIAVTGQLVFAIGGPRPASVDVQWYIQNVMGRRVIDCGEKPESASLLKIGGNIITLNLMEAVGEAQVFAEKTGLGTAAMEELITESFGSVAGGYSRRLTEGLYAPALGTRPGFAISLAIKDAEHALSIAAQAQVKLPVLELAHQQMRASREFGGECLDCSAMYGMLRVGGGLAFWNAASRHGGR